MTNEFTLKGTTIISEVVITKDENTPSSAGTRIATIVYPEPILYTKDTMLTEEMLSYEKLHSTYNK